MKQFLVLAAVLPLMLVFFVQFSMDQMNSSRAAVLSDIVYAAKEEARQEGCFTDKIISDLKETINARLGVPLSEIQVTATDTVQYRIQGDGPRSDEDWERGLIYYKVSVPIGQIMAGRKMFGIKESDNTYYYTVEGYGASEKLR